MKAATLEVFWEDLDTTSQNNLYELGVEPNEDQLNNRVKLGNLEVVVPD